MRGMSGEHTVHQPVSVHTQYGVETPLPPVLQHCLLHEHTTYMYLIHPWGQWLQTDTRIERKTTIHTWKIFRESSCWLQWSMSHRFEHSHNTHSQATGHSWPPPAQQYMYVALTTAMKTGPNSVSLEWSIEHFRGKGKTPTEEKPHRGVSWCAISSSCSINPCTSGQCGIWGLRHVLMTYFPFSLPMGHTWCQHISMYCGS